MKLSVLALIACLIVTPAYAKYSGGTGEPNDPYQIATAADLMLLGNSSEDYHKQFILTADIDMDRTLPGGRTFDKAVIAPISWDCGLQFCSRIGSPFTGRFDGGGHVISNLHVRGTAYLGLFGQLGSGSEVRNLGIADVNIVGPEVWAPLDTTASNKSGGLVGENLGTVARCYATGMVNGTDCVGGLVGDNWGTVTHSYSTGTVCGYPGVGDLVGVNWTGFVGGLVGSNSGTLTQCYSAGAVSGPLTTGGLVGSNGLVASSRGTVTTCFWDIEASGQTVSAGGIGKTTAEMQTAATFFCWLVCGNEGGIWTINEGSDYPRLRWENKPGVMMGAMQLSDFLRGTGTATDPYLIYTAEDVNVIGLFPCEQDAHFRLAFLAGEGTTENPYVIETLEQINLLNLCPYGQDASFKLGFVAGEGTQEEPYLIQTAGELTLVGMCHYGWEAHFKLTVDIDLAPSLPGGRVFDRAVIAPDINDANEWFQGVSFDGVFDGGGHTISHLTVRGGSCVGLFGYLAPGAEVRNLGLVDVNITGSGDYVGGLAGSNDGTVTGCYSTGAVTGDGNDVGGLVGDNGGILTQCYSMGAVHGDGNDVGGLVGDNFGTLTQCHTTSVVSGNEAVGGLVGWNSQAFGGEDWSPLCNLITECYSNSTVRADARVGGLVGDNQGVLANCYCTGAVAGDGNNVGGLVGSNSGSVTCCYSTGAVSGPVAVGGLVGSNGLAGGWGGTVTNCLWDAQTSGQGTSDGGVGETTARMQDASTFLNTGWDFVGETGNGTHEVWQMPHGGGYPFLAAFNGYTPPALRGLGTPDDPYLISDASELGAMVHYSPYAHYRLSAPIDLSGICWATAVVPRFEGTFDGNGIEISHLTIRGGGFLGLFGNLAHGAAVTNLGVIDVNVAASGDYVGGLAGSGATITNCHTTGSVSGRHYVGGLAGSDYEDVTNCYSTGVVGGQSKVGGLVGQNGGQVTDSDSTARVNGTVRSVGGLVGCNYDKSGVTHCFSTGIVDGNDVVGGLVGENYATVARSCSSGPVSGNWSVGGLVGRITTRSTVTQCYSTGAVSGNSYVGGLVGESFYASDASVIDSYSTGAVTGTGDSTGGLVGYYYGLYVPVARCYSVGRVRGTSNVGGLVGSGWLPSYRTDSFWDRPTSGQATSAGGTGKTTAEMQTASTFLDAGWDFVGETANGTADIWKIAEGLGYPRLSWEKYSGGTGEPNDPYQIATATDLIALGETPEDYDKHFIMIADIDLDPNLPGREVFDRALIAPDVNDLQYNFQGTAFTGAFDGSGHTIRNLTIVDPNHDYLGLFGMIAAGGRVSNLDLANAEIAGGKDSINVGTLAGFNAGTLAGCSATGVVIGCGNVRELAGSNSGTIANCRADVRVSWLCI